MVWLQPLFSDEIDSASQVSSKKTNKSLKFSKRNNFILKSETKHFEANASFEK